MLSWVVTSPLYGAVGRPDGPATSPLKVSMYEIPKNADTAKAKSNVMCCRRGMLKTAKRKYKGGFRGFDIDLRFRYGCRELRRYDTGPLSDTGSRQVTRTPFGPLLLLSTPVLTITHHGTSSPRKMPKFWP